MDDNNDVAELAANLARFARTGIFASLGGGANLQLPVHPHRSVSLSDIQAATDSFPDTQVRDRMQQRLGLAPYIHLSQRERNELFAESCGRRKWSQVPRSEQDRPLRLLARWLLDSPQAGITRSSDAALTAYNGWDVVEYEVRNVLPDGDHGTAIQTHWRRIRSKLDGLSEFRITQNANWASGQMPSYKMVSGGQLRIENVRETIDGSEPGYRFDLVIEIAPLVAGEWTDLRWIREYEYLPGDIGRPGDDNSMVIAPIVRVDHAVMSVRFSRELPPRSVWTISNVPNQDRTVIPTERQFVEPVSGLVSAEFFDLPIGYTSGIGWSWGPGDAQPD